MIAVNGWEQQPGGLYLAATPFDKNNPEHRESVTDVMRAVIQTVAQTHGAAFSEMGLRDNMRAVHAGRIKVRLFLAKWEVCAPHPVYVGAAIGWPTYGIDPCGRMRRAIYTEDICLLKPQLRQLIREKPKGARFPDEGLAQAFERINLDNMAKTEDVWFRYGEVDPDNTTMMRSLGGNGALIGADMASAVLEFTRLPNDLMDRLPMNTVLRPLDDAATSDGNNFVVGWGEGGSDFRVVVTRAQATAVGRARTDMRPWHNGNLPDPKVLECVTASSLRTIDVEVAERKWNEPQAAFGAYSLGQPDPVAAWARAVPSPRIPLLGSRTEAWGALQEACGQELLISAAQRPHIFGAPMPDAHVSIINDKHVLDAFLATGARPRFFGHKPMMPGVNVVKPLKL